MQTMKLELIDPSTTNPRRHFDQMKLEELAKSIAANGVIQPVLLRPHPRKDGEYELVAGERRYRASLLADQDDIPYVLRELADDEVLELQLTENSEREDVTPLEESDAMVRLVEEHGRTAEQIADKLGRSVGYVTRRVRLAELIEPLRGLLEDERIGLGSAELLSQAPADLQEEIAADDLDPEKTWYGDPATWSKSDVKRVISRRTRQLENAPWDLDQPFTSPPAPACHHCPKRSGAQPSLLAEFQNGDRCLDEACWAQKTQAWWKRRREEAKDEGAEVLDDKEADKVFGDFWRQRTYVRADDHISGGKSWGEVAPSSVKRVVALENGYHGPKSVTLLRKQDVLDQLEAESKTALVNKILSRTGSSSAEKREERRKLRERRDARVAELVDWIEGQAQLNKDMIHHLALAAIKSASVDSMRRVRKRRELERDTSSQTTTGQKRGALLAAVEDMTAAEMFAIAVELLIIPHANPNYSIRKDGAWWTWAEFAGVEPDYKSTEGADDE